MTFHSKTKNKKTNKQKTKKQTKTPQKEHGTDSDSKRLAQIPVMKQSKMKNHRNVKKPSIVIDLAEKRKK